MAANPYAQQFSIPAKYAGTCPRCHERYPAGTQITKRDGVWQHLRCESTTNAPGRIAQRSTHHSQLTATRSTILDAQITATDLLAAIATSDANEDAELNAMATRSADIAAGAAHDEELRASTFIASKYQHDIFKWLIFARGHAVVEAVAGSGKTTTCVQAVRWLPLAVAYNRGLVAELEAQRIFDSNTPDPAYDKLMSSVDVAFCAFNKHIADELSARMPDWVYTATLHSLGYADLKSALGAVNVDEDKRWDALYFPYSDFVYPKRWRDLDSDQRAALKARRNALKQVVSLCKATLTDYNDRGAVQAMIEYYGLEIDADVERILTVLPDVMQSIEQSTLTIDFDDMQYLPVKLNLSLRKFDYLFIDEAQDLNNCQAEFVLRSLKPNGRIIAVGDRKQSLYGFRGANVDAIPELIKRLDATVLPLSISYRCPASHVVLAKRIVPAIEARDNAPEGTIADMTEAQMGTQIATGDLVVCRTNAPLVPVCFNLIRRGIKATIRGKDIGKSLSELAKRLADGAESMNDFYSKLSEYAASELHKLDQRNASETQIQSLNDKVDTLYAVAGECSEPIAVSEKIESIFSDNVGEIVLSSVHRAKGLESSTVWIVRPELMPFPKAQQQWEVEQELNIKYVALTRSKCNLYFVK